MLSPTFTPPTSSIPTLTTPTSLNTYFNSDNQYAAVLFKIDESYKIVPYANNIINIHNKVYENINNTNIYFHPDITNLFPNLLDEYNFFEDEINDIDIISIKINNLSKSIIDFKALLNKPDSFNSINLTSGKLINNKIIGYDNFDNIGFDYLGKNEYYVLFNKYFLTTYFIKTNIITVNELKTFFPEFNLLNTIQLDNETLNTYKLLFKNITNEEIIITKLNILLQKSTNKMGEVKPSFETIKLYFELTYKITNNIEDRVQFNTIYNRLLKDTNITNEDDKNKIHKLLPVVLKELGLDKKRYAAGIFWYGLVLYVKDNELNLFNNNFIKIDSVQPKLNNDELSNKMEELKIKREEEYKIFKEFQDIQKLQNKPVII